MDSSTTTTKEIARDLPPLLRVYKDGTVDRFLGSPIVPPIPHDPETGVSSKDIVISQNPLISARVHLPKKQSNHQKLPILIYFHGGAFCLESAFSFLHQRYLNIVASEANVLVVSVEYRLAPEHPLPAAYEDGWEALKWVTSHSITNNKDPSFEPWLIDHGDFNRFYIGGDTSGANIAHYVALRVGGGEKLPGDVKIAGALLAFPLFWSSEPVLDEPVEGHEQSLSLKVWNFVYPDAPGGIDNPLINPLADGAPSLATFGSNKILIFIAGDDGLRDRGIWFYDAVKKSGWEGDVELVRVDGEEHCFQIYHPETENSKDMIKRIASFLV